MRTLPEFNYLDVVRFSAEFLRSTCQYTGPEAPTHVGPFAEGLVADPAPAGLPEHILVRFDNGRSCLIHRGNMEAIK